jgi:hypothetical protein
VALCAALAAGPGGAQEDSANVGSDRGASRTGGVSPGGDDIIGGADAQRNDSGGNRGAGQNRPGEADTAHAASAVHAGPGTDPSRKGATAPASAPGAAPADIGATLGRGIEPIRLEGGSANLQRRANRKLLIANAPKMPSAPSANIGAPSANLGAIPPFKRSGMEHSTTRNAIGVVVPGGGQGFDHAPSSLASAGIGVRGPGGAGASTGNVSSTDGRRVAVPPNAVTSPVTHASGINGTTMGHIASGPAYIGGPAKERSGINGTATRPRH